MLHEIVKRYFEPTQKTTAHGTRLYSFIERQIAQNHSVSVSEKGLIPESAEFSREIPRLRVYA